MHVSVLPHQPPGRNTPGDDLSPEERVLVEGLLEAYRHGAFPMGDLYSGRIDFFETDPRGVIPLGAFNTPDGLSVPRTLRQKIRQRRFRVTTDTAFRGVVCQCADPRRPGGWITPDLVTMYELLFRAGYAHSVEAWAPRTTPAPAPPHPHPDPTSLPTPRRVRRSDALAPLPVRDGDWTLVGGLYGVAIGRFFAGESMFSRPDLGGTDASKVCLVHLVDVLRSRGFRLLDAQMHTPHLARLGCREVRRAAFHAMLREALPGEAAWPPPGELAPPEV